MKPLSFFNYGRNNKGKVIRSMKAILVAVAFLIVLYAFIETIYKIQYDKWVSPFEYSTTITFNEGIYDKEKILDEIRNNENLKEIVEVNKLHGIRYSGPGFLDNAVAIGVKERDQDKFLKNQNITLEQGVLPKDEQKEIAINKSIAKNRNLHLGDMIGSDENSFDTLPGAYKIVGFVEGKGLYSIYSAKEVEKVDTYFLFPKDGKIDSLNQDIIPMAKENFIAENLSFAIDNFNKSMKALKSADIITVLALIVMIITVGTAKYAEFLNRKEEIGTLNSIGYSKQYLMKRAFTEVLIVNLIGLTLGVVVGIGIDYIICKVFWAKIGFDGSLITKEGVAISILLAMFTTLFTIIPINNTILKLDSINIIEGE